MVFCGNCGARNEDGTAFCAECGSPLVQQPQPEQAGFDASSAPASVPPPGNPPEKAKKKFPVAIVAVAAVVVVAVIVAIALLSGGKGYERTAVSAVEAIFKPNTEIIFTKLTPKKVLNEFLDEADMDMEDLTDQCEDLDDGILDAKEDLADELDEKLKFSYEARRSKDLSNRDLKDLKEDYEDEYGVKISAAKKVTVRVTVKAGKEKEHFDISDIVVIRTGGKWYIELGGFARSMAYLDNNLYNLF